MGIGRREFLAAFGTVLARLATDSSPAAARHDYLYLNRRFGIAFRCPPGWDFISLHDMGEIQKGQLFATDDAEQNAAILGSLDLPFVALSPVADPHICAQMYLARPLSETDVVHELMKEMFNRPNAVSPDLAFPGPIRIIRRDWQIARGVLNALTVTDLPKQLSVSNCLAAEYTADYDFEHEQLEGPRRVTVRSVAIEHMSRHYLLRLISDVAAPFDFSTFLDGIYLI